jgi:uroporphyrinogen decarboxylase
MTALECKPLKGRVPHFELVFFLTMEAFSKVHPIHRNFTQWDQMSENERSLQRHDIAELCISIARKFEHSAIFFQPPQGWTSDPDKEQLKTLENIRDLSAMEYFLMMHGDATYEIPCGDRMISFVNSIADHPEVVKDTAQKRVDEALSRALKFRGVLDGFALCSDYCFNSGPFLSPAMFDEFILPYLTQLIAGYREMGFYTIKHSDGNIMPILNSIISAKPHALHSLDPQGGVDIAKVKRLTAGQLCLIGNVNCGLLDTGSDEEIICSARYSLKNGMPGGGYIFSTSNCVYPGMNLKRYEMMLNIWRKEGNYE